MNKTIHILGTRGIPAKHGGFETFAEKFSIYLAGKGWDVFVYCQETGRSPIFIDTWNAVKRVHVSVPQSGTMGTIMFDLRSLWHAMRSNGIFLTLGYNTAIFCAALRIRGKTNIINMDGIEWSRMKWGPFARSWLWLNDWAGCWIGNHLVADHPRIKDHLATRVRADKITMIPYGGDEVLSADAGLLAAFSIQPGAFSVIIARPEPENSVLEMVRAFSSRHRGHKLLVLGNFDPARNAFHKKVMSAASNEVIFPGAIYEAPVVQALRFYSKFYLHGHRVGGTNPSLVEAMGAGCAVIAHDNQFNRWVAGPKAAYFKSEAECALLFDRLLSDNTAVQQMKVASQERFLERFTWEQVLSEYETLLSRWHPKD